MFNDHCKSNDPERLNDLEYIIIISRSQNHFGLCASGVHIYRYNIYLNACTPISVCEDLKTSTATHLCRPDRIWGMVRAGGMKKRCVNFTTQRSIPFAVLSADSCHAIPYIHYIHLNPVTKFFMNHDIFTEKPFYLSNHLYSSVLQRTWNHFKFIEHTLVIILKEKKNTHNEHTP